MKLKITLLAFLLALLGTAYGQNRKGNFRLSPGSSLHTLYVSFKTGAPQPDEIPEFSALTGQYAIILKKAFSFSESKLQELEASALKKSGSAGSISKLQNIYRLEIAAPDNIRLYELAKALEALDEVEYCTLMPLAPIQPPYDIAPITPLFEDQQGYITPMAVNMQYAWDMGLNGQGINLRDVEYGVNLAHEELNERNIAHAFTISPEVTTEFAEHGTAVFGIMYADKGNYGISGMAHGANEMVLFPEYPVSGYDRINAIAYSIEASSEGDIIVYEMQTFGPTDQYCPAEYDNVVWDLTKAATDAGIVIVAAAGNGNQNLDGVLYFPYMQRGDSGAIIVGAGSNNQNRTRMSFSTYGSRVDVQAWGQGVFTTGYGNALQIGGDFNQNYTNFSGTSSATPIVASCVAVLQSYYHGLTGEYLTGIQMRDLLVETGKQQNDIWQGYIGPLPDMEGAITQIANMMGAPTHERASFSVYPNPVQDKLTVNAEGFAGSVNAEVYNSLGQLVNAVDVSAAGREIDFSGLSGGVYFVKVSDGDISLTKRVIKK